MLLLYFLVLIKFILIKNPSFFFHRMESGISKHAVAGNLRSANFTPFKTIHDYLSGALGVTIAVENIGGNFLGFIPLGILLPLLFISLRNGFKIILCIFFISLGFETFQLLTDTGQFDVDDLILNTTGGYAGFLIYYFFKPHLKHNL